jgi:hypothetical protein
LDLEIFRKKFDHHAGSLNHGMTEIKVNYEAQLSIEQALCLFIFKQDDFLKRF